MTQSNNSNISSNSVKSGDDFRYLYITTQITHTHTQTNARKQQKVEFRGQQHRPLAHISLSSSHHRQSPSSSASRAVKINTHTGLTFLSAWVHTHTHISYSGVLLRCNNKRNPHRLWQPSAPPRGALVFMSAWVHIGEWAIRSECVRVGCSQHRSLGVMQNNAYIKQMNKHRKNTSKPAIYNVKTWTTH